MATISRAKCLCTQLLLLVVASFLTTATANGQQLTPSLTASPAKIDFGHVKAASSNSQTVTLTNSGTSVTVAAATGSITISAASGSIAVSDISVSGQGFGVTGVSLPLNLAAGQSTKFTVTFASIVAITASGSVNITSNASTPSLIIPLTGAVVQGSLWPEHASIAFPHLQIGTSSSREIKLTNNGGTRVTISTVSPSGTGFGRSQLALPIALEPGDYITFAVTFAPTTDEVETGSIDIASDGSNPSLSISLSGKGDEIMTLPECSLAKTNNQCKVIIDRAHPVAPPTVQMYSNQALTVVVKNTNFYERYFLDYQIGQAGLSPEPASSIVQNLLPPLGKLQVHGFGYSGPSRPTENLCSSQDITRMPTAQHVKDVVHPFQDCFAQLATIAIDIYRQLEPLVAPDSRSPYTAEEDVDLFLAQDLITDFLNSEFAASSRISAIAADATLKASAPDAPAIQQLTSLQKLADAVATDLLGYSQRLTELEGFDNGTQDCATIIKATPKDRNQHGPCIWITSGQDSEHVYQHMVTRTITYSLNTLNLISNSQQAAADPSKKKQLASIAISFADSPPSKVPGAPFSALRWEASAGAFFSFLPVRSFSVAPIFSGGQVVDNKVAQNILHPTVVPFAAANYRLYDLPRTRWRYAIYWTGAVGVNPNTVSADFASGLSISWRSLMFSPLWHYGHDVRLTQGFYVGESLGAGFKGSLPTQSYWKSSFAIGVSIRVPSLTGR